MKIEAPRDCPKCGYEGAFRGPHYRGEWSGLHRGEDMEWRCPGCGFKRYTEPFDRKPRELDEAGRVV